MINNPRLQKHKNQVMAIITKIRVEGQTN